MRGHAIRSLTRAQGGREQRRCRQGNLPALPDRDEGGTVDRFTVFSAVSQ